MKEIRLWHLPAYLLHRFLFDGVLAVGDEEFKEKCRLIITEIMAGEKVVFIVSHDKEDMQRYCDGILSLTHGVACV